MARCRLESAFEGLTEREQMSKMIEKPPKKVESSSEDSGDEEDNDKRAVDT